MDGVDACYHFAGIVGVHPRALTLRRLWQMTEGRNRQQRSDMLEQASLVWAGGDVDLELYLFCGLWIDSNVGRPMKYSPEMEARIEQEVAKIRSENPDLPQLKGP